MMGAPTVVFDLDGTLVDSAPDLVATVNTVFAREGLPPVAYETARNLVGGGARSLIERSLRAEGRKLGVGEVDRLVKEFIAHYAAHIADRSRPFPGLEATLDELSAVGCRFAVCTNKLEWLSVRLLDALGLSKRFVAICGADTFGLRKPNPEFLRRTIARAGGEIGHAVMVGDSGTDVATARAAGVPVIAVDYGYTETPVAELGPERVISALSELPSGVFELLRVPSPTTAEQC
ncbi:MAG: phosphoglycolate phosphatase [Xanthobacteraceae bacterium]